MEKSAQPNSELREELRSDADKIATSAKQRLTSEVDARKGAAVTHARSISSAFGTAANELTESPAWLRSIFEQGAETVQRFADTIDRKDARELLNDVQQIARSNPALFLGGCAALGFAAARLFRAGGEASMGAGSPQYRSSAPGSPGWEPQPGASASAPENLGMEAYS
jgi:hypothetical protein